MLTGNGVSTGFNQDLRLDLLTNEVLSRFVGLNFEEDEIRDALAEIANLLVPDGEAVETDFEKLVGAFDGDFLRIQHLRLLARSYSSNPTRILDARERCSEEE